MPNLTSIRHRRTSGLARKALARKALARKALVGLAVLALAGSAMSSAPANAAPPGHAPLPQHDKVVPGHLEQPAAHRSGRPARPARPAIKPFHEPAPPSPALLRVPPGLRRDVMASPTPAMSRVGKSPVRVGSVRGAVPGRVRVRVFGHALARKAGVDGVLVQLSSAGPAKATGPVSVWLDYAKFK